MVWFTSGLVTSKPTKDALTGWLALTTAEPAKPLGRLSMDSVLTRPASLSGDGVGQRVGLHQHAGLAVEVDDGGCRSSPSFWITIAPDHCADAALCNGAVSRPAWARLQKNTVLAPTSTVTASISALRRRCFSASTTLLLLTRMGRMSGRYAAGNSAGYAGCSLTLRKPSASRCFGRHLRGIAAPSPCG